MPVEFGVQSYTYRSFDIESLPAELDSTPVSAVEVYSGHLGPDDDTDHVERVLDNFKSADLQFCGAGVFTFEDPEEVRAPLEFASDIGALYVSAHFQPDDHETIQELIDVAAELDLFVATHNHGPGAIYSTVEEVLEVLDAYPDATHLGACVDTGHFFRSGQSPAEVIPALGERIHAVHVKDFLDTGIEVVPGDGNLDILDLLNLLETHASLSAPPVIEYEEDEMNPTPTIKTICEQLSKD
jgi:sugar phosphate isomerase/epimerase